jgi:hypothetical protein
MDESYFVIIHIGYDSHMINLRSTVGFKEN